MCFIILLHGSLQNIAPAISVDHWCNARFPQTRPTALCPYHGVGFQLKSRRSANEL